MTLSEGGHRARLAAFMDSEPVQHAVTAAIVVNAVTLGLETAPSVMAEIGGLLRAIDRIILGIFVVELSLKLYAQGPRFFLRGWNLFDFVIVGMALLPSAGALSVLRALRILRVLRLISVVPSMRRVVTGFLAALPGVSSVLALLLLIFYVYAVMATRLYGAEFPELFATVGASMYTLFQVMTLDDWSESVVRPIMEEHPYAWVMFVTFVLATSFAVLNLFIAVIVNAMQEQHAAEEAKTRREVEAAAHKDAEALAAHVVALREEVRVLRGMLERALAGR
ncbi:MAG TPA: ion transporter [Alphaproteobacteria bacterium]|jgi:voltage-gated sodium channel